MTLSEFLAKFKKCTKITSTRQVSYGDEIVYYSLGLKKAVRGKIENTDYYQSTLYLNDNSAINIDHIECFLYDKSQLTCSCGAKFTSNPTFHSDWCDNYAK